MCAEFQWRNAVEGLRFKDSVKKLKDNINMDSNTTGATVLIMQLTISRSSTHIFRSTDPVTLHAITQVHTHNNTGRIPT